MNLLQFYRRIRKALKDPGRKKINTIFWEYMKFKLFKPSVAQQYFHKRLYRKRVKNPDDYILTHELQEKIWYFNDMIYYFNLENKKRAEIFFNLFDIPYVKSLAYNRNTLFFTNDRFRQIHNPEQFLDFLTDLKVRDLHNDHLIIKPVRAHGGRGIVKVSIDEMQNNKTKLEGVFNRIVSSDYIFQHLIEQHPELNGINPNSLNTIRVDTFINKEQIPKILCMRLRCSAGNSFLDNISNGGLFIGIDSDKGTLHQEGFNDFGKYSGQIYTKHPLTGISFGDFKIPFFSEVKQMAMDAARLLPRAKVVAWDIAVQPQGPLIVEGNYFPGLLNSEIVQKGFRNHPVFKEILEELNLPQQLESDLKNRKFIESNKMILQGH